MFSTPIINLSDVAAAHQELEYILANGAGVALIEPVRSTGCAAGALRTLPEFDPFWHDVEAAGLPIVPHASYPPLARRVPMQHLGQPVLGGLRLRRRQHRLDKVMFGADCPHPEGLAEPNGFWKYAEGMDERRTYDFMGDNAFMGFRSPTPIRRRSTRPR